MSLRHAREATTHQHPINIRHTGDGRTSGERIADAIAARVGSWPFILVQSALLLSWIILNGVLISDWLGGEPFDPYPFILLNLVLSFQAAYTGPVVLMSQNRQSARDRDVAEHDFDIDRRAVALLERIRDDQARLEELLLKKGTNG